MRAIGKHGQILSSSITLGWKLFLMAALALFVAITVGDVFTSNQDVRPAEASILANRIMNCITADGIIQTNFSLENCFVEDNELYVSANLTSIESNFSRNIISGDPAMNVFCKIQDKTKEGTTYCMDQRYYVLINNQTVERGVLDLTIGVKKYESNI